VTPTCFVEMSDGLFERNADWVFGIVETSSRKINRLCTQEERLMSSQRVSPLGVFFRHLCWNAKVVQRGELSPDFPLVLQNIHRDRSACDMLTVFV
jgi:hypothetical protein